MEDLAEDLTGYVRGLFAPEDQVLEELRGEMARRGLPEIQVSADEGRLLQVLLRAVRARRVLEIGTLGGYSAIWMARALEPGGRLLTLEIDPDRAALAREFARRAGLERIIEVRVGVATQVLGTLEGAEPPFDAVFIDADKESYPRYLDQALRLLRPGGLLIGDNAFWSGRVLEPDPEEDATRAMREFNRRIAEHPALHGTIIPVRDGLAVAVYTPAS